jgi:hypothetical protein
MPSVIIGQPLASGPQVIISGNYFSGSSGRAYPVGGVFFKMPFDASGQVYIGLSGGMSLNSGTALPGGGMLSGQLDGIPLGKSESYTIPALVFKSQASGFAGVFARHDPAVSGITRLSFEIL